MTTHFSTNDTIKSSEMKCVIWCWWLAINDDFKGLFYVQTLQVPRHCFISKCKLLLLHFIHFRVNISEMLKVVTLYSTVSYCTIHMVCLDHIYFVLVFVKEVNIWSNYLKHIKWCQLKLTSCLFLNYWLIVQVLQ